MADQRLQTSLLLDATLTSGYQDAFASASKLMNDLNKHSNALEKELKQLGKQADGLDQIGESSDVLRRDMTKLEKQIAETNRAVGKFGDAKMHFRNAKIGASGLKNELSDIVGFAGKAALGIAGIGTAAGIALSPPQELQEFDAMLSSIRAISVGVDPSSFDDAKAQMLDLSNYYGLQASEISAQFQQLTRNIGFEGATQSIAAALDFQTATGLSIAEIEEELATARISLGVDTAVETEQFLGLLQQAYSVGIKIDNLDLGDLETLTARVGTDLASEDFQREFLTTIAFRQVDSFQFADYAAAFKEEIERATFISPDMDLKDIEKAQKAIAALEKYGIRAEDGLTGAMRVYQNLSEIERVAFFQELEPVLTAMPAEVIARGSEALPQIEAQVNMALGNAGGLSDAADDMLSSWSATWGRIGRIGQNTMGILQERFASTFGPQIVEGAERLFTFMSAHTDDIHRFFSGVRDTLSPVIEKVWSTLKQAWPDVRSFALDVWEELQGYWNRLAPVATAFGNAIWSIVKPIVSFVAAHPKLVATVIAGIVAWKAYTIASTAVQTGFDFIAGGASLVTGHFHRLNAIAIGNQRVVGGVGNTALSTGRKFLEMGRNMLATKFPRFSTVISGLGKIGTSALGALPGIVAMGSGLWAAVVPVLPVVLPIIAAIGVVAGLGVLVYKNWDGISSFFSTHFETIRNALMIVFPPLGILIGLAGVIKDNWQPIKAFFAEVWNTIKLTAGIAWEGVKFIFLSAVNVVRSLWYDTIGFFSGVWGSIRGVFLNSPLAPIFEGIVSGIKTVVSPLLNFFSDIWGGISEMAGRAIGWITDKFKWMNDVLGKVFGWLKRKNKELSDDLKGIETTAETKITQEVTGAIADKNLILDAPVIHQEQPVVEMQGQDTPIIQLPQTQQPMINMPAQTTQPVLSLPEQTQPVFDSPDVRVQSPSVSVDNQQPAMEQAIVSPEAPIIEQSHKPASVVVNQDAPIVNLPQTQSPIISQPTIDAPAVNQDAPILSMPETTIEQAGPIVNLPETTQPVFDVSQPNFEIPEQVTPAVEQLITNNTLETPIVAGSTDMNLSELPVNFESLDIPAVSITQEQPVMNVETPNIEQTAPIVNLPAQTVNPVVEQPTIDTPVMNVETPNIEQTAPIVNLPAQTVNPVVEQPTIDTPIVNQASPIVSMPETAQPVVEQPTIDTPIVNQAQPIISMPEQTVNPVIQQPTIDAPDIIVQETIGKPIVNIPEGTQQVIDVSQPALADLDIPSVDIVNPDGTVLNVEQMQDTFIETTETMPVSPMPVSQTPTASPASPQTTTQITNETSNDNGRVTINNTFNISASTAEDGEEIAEIVRRIVEEQLNTANERFLTL